MKCHSEPFAVILSEAKDLALGAQGKLREASCSAPARPSPKGQGEIPPLRCAQGRNDSAFQSRKWDSSWTLGGNRLEGGMTLLSPWIIVICSPKEVFDEDGKGVSFMDGRNRSDVARGADVSVVLKEDQPTGKQTRGIVQDLLTKSSFHPHGIKVRLQDGKVGRVQVIHSAGHSSRA